MLRTLLLAAGLLPMLACRPSARAADRAGASDASASPLVLRLDKASYRRGEQPRLTMVNTGTATYSFNPCTRSLEQRDNASWRPVVEEPRMCTMEAWMLRGGDSVSAAIELPENLGSGEFRVRLAMGTEGAAPGEGRLSVASPPFTVRP